MPIPKNYASPDRFSAKEKAFHQLQRWVIEGTLEPGEKLKDAELAEALGVSRTPVREALQMLENQGFVEMNPGRDTRVTTINKTDVLKIYPPLAALQALAGELAVERIQAEQIEQLRQLNRRFAYAIQTGQPFQAMESDEEFHHVIIDICDNPYLSSFISTLQMHTRRMKYLFLTQHLPTNNTSVAEHDAIIDALEKKDTERAVAMLKQNWTHPMQELMHTIDDSPENN